MAKRERERERGDKSGCVVHFRSIVILKIQLHAYLSVAFEAATVIYTYNNQVVISSFHLAQCIQQKEVFLYCLFKIYVHVKIK